MTWYRSGKVAVKTGSEIVTGDGVSWIDNVGVGEGFQGPDGRIYEIVERLSSKELRIMPPYLGPTANAQSYAIAPTQSYIRDLAERVGQLLGNFQGIADSAGAGRFASGTEAVPGMRFDEDEDTGIRRTGANALALVTGGKDRIKVDDKGNVSGITKAMVGLGKADDTADKDKPISTLQRAAIDAKIGPLTVPSDTDWDKMFANGVYQVAVPDPIAASVNLPVLNNGSSGTEAHWIITVFGESKVLQRAFNVARGVQAGRTFTRRFSVEWGPWMEQLRALEPNGATALPAGAAINASKVLSIGEPGKAFAGTNTYVHGVSVVMRVPSTARTAYMFHSQPTFGEDDVEQEVTTHVNIGAYAPYLANRTKITTQQSFYAQYVNDPAINTAYGFYGSMSKVEGCTRYCFAAVGNAPNFFMGEVLIGEKVPNGIDKLRTVGAVSSSGPAKHGQYTLRTLPSAATYNGYLIDVTDATGGVKTCRSDGSAWKILNTTTTVS